MLLLLLLVCQLLLQRQSGVEMFHSRTGRFELATTGAAISLTAPLSVRLKPLLLYQCRGPNRNFELLRRSDKKKKDTQLTCVGYVLLFFPFRHTKFIADNCIQAGWVLRVLLFDTTDLLSIQYQWFLIKVDVILNCYIWMNFHDLRGFCNFYSPRGPLIG